MRIPRDFDRWMFDYKEGNLSQSEISYFENNMLNNPELNADIDAWDKSFIKKEDVVYLGAASLQKQNKFALYFGWTATILLLIGSVIGTYSFLFNKSNVYELRGKSGLYYSPFIASNNNNNQSQIKNTAILNIVNTTPIINSNIPTSIINDQLNNTTSPTLTKTTLIKKDLSNNNSIDNNYQHIEKKSILKNIELNKISNEFNSSEKNIASYSNNPKYTSETTKSYSNKRKRKSFNYRFKKMFRKIEKMTGYPIGLINLKDPEILTPNISLLNINSGFVGGYGVSRFETKYRNQWFGKNTYMQSTSISYDTYSKSIKSGIGISLNRNNFNNGAVNDNKINLFYSPKFAITKKLIFEPAIKLSLGLMTIDNSKLNSQTNYEVERGRIATPIQSNDIFTANNLWYKDYGLGFVLNGEMFYLGLNADNLSQHKQTVFGENEKSSIDYTAILGMDYQSKTKKMVLSPYITYQNNTYLNEFWAGTNFQYNWLTVGVSYSSKNDFSSAIGIKTKSFKLIYQYDMTTSYLNQTKFGSHTLGIRFNTKRRNLK